MNLTEWLGKDNSIGQDIWIKKYQKNNETLDEWFERISNGNNELKQLLIDKKFLFGGRILSNRGLEKQGKKITFSNCYVLAPPEDNLESIFQCASDVARTFSYGGGVGVDLSKLSPRGATIHNAAKSTTGAVSFMDLYSLVSELIGSEGRRGALMLSLDCTHPDLEEFIEVKNDPDKVTKANISVRITDDFMEAVKSNSDFKLSFYREESDEKIEKIVNARDILYQLAEMNWEMGEPGVLFWNRISDYNLLNEFDDFEYSGVNPCLSGDTIIKTTKGSFPIKDLVGSKPVCYCMDEEGDLVVSSAVKVFLTKKNAEVVEIKTKTTSLVCTPDHRIFTLNRGWVEAEQLTKGDKLKGINTKTYKEFGKPNEYLVESVKKLDKTIDVYDIEMDTNHNFLANNIIVHNCAEESLPAGGSCLLGSINLSEFVRDGKFDFEDLKKTVAIAVTGLNDVLDEGIELHPLKIQRDTVKDWKQVGLGIMGLADMLIKLKIRYGSDEAIKLCDKIGNLIATESIKQSSILALDREPFGKCDNEKLIKSSFFKSHPVDVVKHTGLRNSQLLTCAPTGTLSTLLGISGGLEPIFDLSYTRKTESLHGEDRYYKIYTPIVDNFMKENNIEDESLLPDYFITSKTLNYEDRIKMQQIWQNHIDASISSTVNLPETATVDDVFNIYVKAHEAGLKGITVFRDGCKRTGILTSNDSKEQLRDVPTNAIGKKRKLITGCGSLHIISFYHPETGDLLETYLNKGSTGGCNNFMIGLSRMLSLAARSGASIEDIVDQLKSTGTCSSYAVRRATKKDTSQGSCCPMAIANALIDMHSEMQSELKSGIVSKPKLQESIPAPIFEFNAVCPECGSALAFEGGCSTCKNCGYSKCS